MKEIKLTNGMVVQVDDEDFDLLSKYTWTVMKSKKLFYAVNATVVDGRRHLTLMHRKIMNTPRGMECDHRDRDGLNNQKYNLRNCTRQQNSWNKKVSCKTRSGFKGISLDKNRNKYLARIKLPDGKTKGLGYFINPVDAAKAYNKAALEHFGEFAQLNKVD